MLNLIHLRAAVTTAAGEKQRLKDV